jgi:hypothetical protein
MRWLSHTSKAVESTQVLTDVLCVIRLEVPIPGLVEVNDDCHHFADTQLPCSVSFLASISNQFLFPNRQEDLAKIIYTHK